MTRQGRRQRLFISLVFLGFYACFLASARAEDKSLVQDAITLAVSDACETIEQGFSQAENLLNTASLEGKIQSVEWRISRASKSECAGRLEKYAQAVDPKFKKNKTSWIKHLGEREKELADIIQVKEGEIQAKLRSLAEIAQSKQGQQGPYRSKLETKARAEGLKDELLALQSEQRVAIEKFLLVESLIEKIDRNQKNENLAGDAVFAAKEMWAVRKQERIFFDTTSFVSLLAMTALLTSGNYTEVIEFVAFCAAMYAYWTVTNPAFRANLGLAFKRRKKARREELLKADRANVSDKQASIDRMNGVAPFAVSAELAAAVELVRFGRLAANCAMAAEDRDVRPEQARHTGPAPQKPIKAPESKTTVSPVKETGKRTGLRVPTEEQLAEKSRAAKTAQEAEELQEAEEILRGDTKASLRLPRDQ